MADEDEIDRLLREVAAQDGGAPRAQQPGAEIQPASERAESGRLAWAAVAALGASAAGFVVGALLTFLPWISSMSTALGAAFGAFLVALVSGPPQWFRRKQ